MSVSPIKIGTQQRLSLSAVVEVARGRAVSLNPRSRKLLSQRRRQIVAHVHSHPEPAYGFNRGFGHNVDRAVAPQDLSELQRNLIRSHSCAVGECVSIEVVRGAMVLRAHSLAQGHSGVRPEVVDALLTFLNRGITPCVPAYGSVGASGDLAPLSHIALALIGEGFVFDATGKKVKATRALARAKIKPLALEMKEGLALNNGMQFSTALAILSHADMQKLLKTAALATAMTAQVMLASDLPFAEEVHKLRPHPGARAVSKWIWNLMQNSPMRECHRNFDIDGEIQDPYNLRCAGQILGTCHDLLEQAGATLEIEANSVTDNPLLLNERGGSYTRIVSAGHFHGMPVAVALYNLTQAMGIMARLSNMRCVRYVDENRNKGLGPDLVWPELRTEERAASSAMMVPEYVSAALTNAIWGAAMPSHLFSLSTDAGQEDHVSMAAGLGVRVYDTLPRLAEVLAIELAFAAQAAAIRKISDTLPTKHKLTAQQTAQVKKAQESFTAAVRSANKRSAFEPKVDIQLRYRWSKKDRALSPPCEAVLRHISKVFPIVKKDRSTSEQLRALADIVRSGTLLEHARKAFAA
ncbi:MAG: aromatic amino acid lyase [Deltaproteobacteria bacterium]|nr:aromatic amino acid lyase [Deltaproteobacteria bacterium]